MHRNTILAIVATAATGVALAHAAGASGDDGGAGSTLRVTARTTGLDIVDLAPRRRTSPGDVLVSVSSLSNASGARVGTGHLHCAVTRGGRTFERATFQCSGTNRLKNGTLSFTLVARLAADPVIKAAITGGTGAYAGARGELVNTAGADPDVSEQVITLRP